ncbi:hypothetical protein [Streptomyces hoynatensis]|uniref:Uncharacterized protein n=1 Tax=Streptomyces hoynatensis TaxID=1141874 RepID=A0A3A9ZBP5_9ACTN|nr:hypothetical protein [Streptomyces hoynatensis]RKN45615.1 hypothetical protein D7294_03840 [Streptomyces hoynatensis]
MVTMNIGALQRLGQEAGARNGLAGMKSTFAAIASDPAMFGQVPHAHAASAALKAAAQSMLTELARAGHTVEDIKNSANRAAVIGQDSDAHARSALSAVQVANLQAFVSAIDTGR